ncbi:MULTISPECIES: hypothetical protein [Bacillus cereus group]|uniref:hypothetical protein n=1 Tax=Bacillus cereus group TaxID=86661 RepID=UPI001E553A43|nr:MULTISPECIES: hypothetical protein [Bacillus cereus group]MCC2414304.1 hypothetical protein [Bacillus paranthracis]MDX5923204.1 hypothetical protein [Bacillus cereus group sp. BfR-BA-01033]MDX5975780.1 hypothetical protein [Bacillus cereus group sp. BfR-BA-00287]
MKNLQSVFTVKLSKDKKLYVNMNEYEYNFKIEEVHKKEKDTLFEMTISKHRMLKLSITFALGTTMIGTAVSWLLKLFV